MACFENTPHSEATHFGATTCYRMTKGINSVDPITFLPFCTAINYLFQVNFKHWSLLYI